MQGNNTQHNEQNKHIIQDQQKINKKRRGIARQSECHHNSHVWRFFLMFAFCGLSDDVTQFSGRPV